MKLELLITFLYIIPAILTLINFYYQQDEIKVKELIIFTVIALVPLTNILTGYIFTIVISINRPNAINRFLNKRIK
jgi:hypothetical protein